MLRAFLSSFSIVIIGVGAAFLTHLIFAKVLSASEYGVFSFIHSLSLLTSVCALFGFQNSVVRFLPQFEGQAKKISRLIKFASRFTLFLGIAQSLLIVGALYLFGFEEKYGVIPLLLILCLTPLMVVLRLNSAFMRGFHKSIVSVLYETTLREIILISLIVIFYVAGVELSSGLDALLLFLLALIFSTGISIIHLRKIRHNKPIENVLKKDDLLNPKEWIKISAPMMFTLFAQRLLRRFDIIILGVMTTPALVGAYAIAAQFSDVSGIGQKGIFAVFSSKAAQLYDQGKSDDLKTLYRKMQLYGIVSVGVMTALIYTLAPSLLAFFGAEYSVGYNALLILMVGQLCNISFGPLGVLMMMTKYESMIMKLTFAAAIANIILSPFSVYFYGLEGAAFVTAFLLFLRSLFGFVYMKQKGVL